MSKDRLFEDFPPVSDEQWRSVIEADLKGADYDKKLVWNAPAGFAVQPYYRRGDAEKLVYLKAQAPGAFPYVRGNQREDNRWQIAQAVTQRDPAQANATARQALASGAEAVFFSSETHDKRLFGQRVCSFADFETMLAGIDLNKVSLHLDWGKASPQAAAYLAAYCEKHKLPTSALSGSFGFNPLGQLATTGRVPVQLSSYWDNVAQYLRDVKATFPNMRHLVISSAPFLEAGASLSQSLALVNNQLVEILDALTDRGFAAEDALRLMGVQVSVESSYFMEIAFFRALRLLWADVAAAYGVKSDAAQVWVHAQTCALNKTVYDPHVNILRQTTETMSAVIGGVDVMSLAPWDAVSGTSTPASERLARNTQLVIREESGLDHAIDPSAGSYYIEQLTDGLAEQAWALFRDVEQAGGFLAAFEAGTLSQWLKASNDALEKGTASRRLSLLGTNQFPDGREKRAAKLDIDTGLALTAAQQSPAPAAWSALVAAAKDALPWCNPFLGDSRQVEALPAPRRMAATFEQLRLQVESLEKTPTVYLWTFGSLAFRKARAGFCQNLYACAGLEIVEGKGSSDVAENLRAIAELDAKWVVFCSSDEEYPTQVPAFVEALKAQRPGAVAVVAGYPQDAIDALQKAGVDDFVHLKTNAAQYLGQCVKSCVAHAGGAS